MANLEWYTAPDNATAQRLYDRTGAARSRWVAYELDLWIRPPVRRPQRYPLRVVVACRWEVVACRSM
jgi:hypothetical protein